MDQNFIKNSRGNETFHAPKFLDVCGKVAGDELLTTLRMGEAGMGKGLAMGSQDLLLGTSEPANALCKEKEA